MAFLRLLAAFVAVACVAPAAWAEKSYLVCQTVDAPPIFEYPDGGRSQVYSGPGARIINQELYDARKAHRKAGVLHSRIGDTAYVSGVISRDDWDREDWEYGGSHLDYEGVDEGLSPKRLAAIAFVNHVAKLSPGVARVLAVLRSERRYVSSFICVIWPTVKDAKEHQNEIKEGVESKGGAFVNTGWVWAGDNQRDGREKEGPPVGQRGIQ